MKIALTKTIDFEAAHWLPKFPEGHKCRRLHGHSFKADIIVEGEIDEEMGYLMDFGEIKKVTQPVVEQLDHYCLNDIEGLENPTAEMLAKWIYDKLKGELPLLKSVVVRETCTSSATYFGE
ncbi:6-carboxytetrahydropterin synthase QueD [Poriferisphaera sp. WC338]|uniref:6-carboxytetrahydropterin synthase QueD n=1 Tax=Poriferisphaera sp. WC338 TaxID=3425129 RepID=UPI003D8185A8